MTRRCKWRFGARVGCQSLNFQLDCTVFDIFVPSACFQFSCILFLDMHANEFDLVNEFLTICVPMHFRFSSLRSCPACRHRCVCAACRRKQSRAGSVGSRPSSFASSSSSSTLPSAAASARASKAGLRAGAGQLQRSCDDNSSADDGDGDEDADREVNECEDEDEYDDGDDDDEYGVHSSASISALGGMHDASSFAHPSTEAHVLFSSSETSAAASESAATPSAETIGDEALASLVDSDLFAHRHDHSHLHSPSQSHMSAHSALSPESRDTFFPTALSSSSYSTSLAATSASNLFAASGGSPVSSNRF